MRQKLSNPGVLVFALLAAVAGVIALANEADRKIVINTFALGFAVNLVAIPLGIVYARLCLNSGWVSWSLRLTAVAFLFVPLFVHVSSWDSAFGKLGWLTNEWWATDWQVAGISVAPWGMTIWIHAIAAVPQIGFVLWLGLKSSGRIHEEQAELDANSFAIFWHITLPRLLPLISVCSIWLFVTCAREIAVTDIYRIATFAEQIYLGYSLGDLDTIAGPFQTLAFLIAIASFVLFVAYSLRDENLFASDIKRQSSPRSKNNLFQNTQGVLLLLAIAGIPIANLFARASRFVEMEQGVPTGKYSIQNAMRVITQVPLEYATEFQWSFVIASLSTVIISSTAILVVWFAFNSASWRHLLILTIAITCCLPGPLIGSSLVWLRTAIDTPITNWLFDRTIFGPAVANLIFCWPISCILFWFILKNTAKDTIENFRMEGAGMWTSLTRLVIPENWLALCGGFLIVFANCFGELSASQLAVPPGIDTIPRRMLGLLHSGVNDDTAGLTIVSLVFTMAIVLLGAFIVHWNRTTKLP